MRENLKESYLKAIKVKITSYTSDDQPGFVECKFSDAWGKEHIVEEKVPIVSEILLDANSEYPKDGVIACGVVKEVKDKVGRTIFTVNTEKPWAVYTIDGLSEFDLLEEQLAEIFP